MTIGFELNSPGAPRDDLNPVPADQRNEQWWPKPEPDPDPDPVPHPRPAPPPPPPPQPHPRPNPNPDPELARDPRWLSAA